MPPVLTTKSIVERLTDGIVPAGVARVEIRMLRPGHIHLGMIIVLHPIRINGITSVDLLRGQRVLDISPGQIVIFAVRRE